MSGAGKGVQHRTGAGDLEDDDEGMEVGHLLAEPKNDRMSLDEFFHVEKAPDVNYSEWDSYTGQGGKRNEKVQVHLSDTDRGRDDNRNASIGPATEDYHLDTEFVDKDSDGEEFPHEGVSFENSSFATHSSGYSGSGSESSANGVSESSSTSNGKPRFRNGKYDHRTVCKLHGVPRKKCDCQDQMKKAEPKSLILYTSQNRRKLQGQSGLLSRSGPIDMNLTSFADLHRTSEEASLIYNTKNSKKKLPAGHTIEGLYECEKNMPVRGSTESSTHTRLRKPPVRYIDEFSGSLSLSDEKPGMPRNTALNVRTSSGRDNRHKELKSFKLARHEGFSNRSLLKSSTAFRNTVGQSKEFSPVTTLDSDEESDDEHRKVSPARKGSSSCGDRRKHQMIWTLPEVEKLVDGISHFGVGRWTEIQRLFFPTSTYRTPVDLRDKWRNLLKASNAWMENGQEEPDEESQKNGHRQLPKEILQRINELGRLYPYPVKRSPKPMPKRSSRK